jgi:hypothetical protein
VGYIIYRIDEWFHFREICTPTVREWMFYMNRAINSNLGWLLYMLKRTTDGLPIDPFKSLEGTGHQEDTQTRDVHSEYPQSQIQGTQDYADNADDVQVFRNYTLKNAVTDELQQYLNFMASYREPMEMFLSRLEICFSSLFSTGTSSAESRWW